MMLESQGKAEKGPQLAEKQEKGTGLKGCALCGSNYWTLWKRKNYEDRKEGCGREQGAMETDLPPLHLCPRPQHPTGQADFESHASLNDPSPSAS